MMKKHALFRVPAYSTQQSSNSSSSNTHSPHSDTPNTANTTTNNNNNENSQSSYNTRVTTTQYNPGSGSGFSSSVFSFRKPSSSSGATNTSTSIDQPQPSTQQSSLSTKKFLLPTTSSQTPLPPPISKSFQIAPPETHINHSLLKQDESIPSSQDPPTTQSNLLRKKFILPINSVEKEGSETGKQVAFINAPPHPPPTSSTNTWRNRFVLPDPSPTTPTSTTSSSTSSNNSNSNTTTHTTTKTTTSPPPTPHLPNGLASRLETLLKRQKISYSRFIHSRQDAYTLPSSSRDPTDPELLLFYQPSSPSLVLDIHPNTPLLPYPTSSQNYIYIPNVKPLSISPELQSRINPHALNIVFTPIMQTQTITDEKLSDMSVKTLQKVLESGGSIKVFEPVGVWDNGRVVVVKYCQFIER